MAKNMKFLSFWSINDSLDLSGLKKQLLDLKRHGVEGVVFHPRYYPGNPAYLSDGYMKIVSELILYAKRIRMEFWMYDENGWPSGVADGEVIKRHPDSTVEWVEMLHKNQVTASDSVLSVHEDYCLVVKRRPGISALNCTTTDTFLSLTHQKFKECLHPEAFDYIIGFFADEVSYLDGSGINFLKGGLPWCESLPDRYAQKYSESLTDKLWMIFIDAPGSSTVRIRFWETVTDLLAESFYLPYAEWCKQNGKLFTAHLKGEETPYFQLPYSGSCFAQLKNISLPAIDTLERYSGNHFFPRIVSSVARQNGYVGSLAEAMGGAGWGIGPQHLCDYMLWLADSGIDRVVLHLCQYKLIASGIRDWPPSMPLHLNWHGGFAEVLQSIRKEAKPLLAQADRGDKVLIVTPTRGIAAEFTPWEGTDVNQHNGTNMPDTRAAKITEQFMQLVEHCHHAGLDYHLTEERELAGAHIKNGILHLERCRYRKIIIPESCIFEEKEKELLKQLEDHHLLVQAPSAPADPAIPPSAPTTSTVKPQQTGWKITAPKENQLFLSLKNEPNGFLSATYENMDYPGECHLVLSDPAEQVTVNGKTIPGELRNTQFTLPKQTGMINLRVKSLKEHRPFAFLRGGFLVQAIGGFVDFDQHQRATQGIFAIRARKKLLEGCLLEQGLPFCSGLVKAEKEIVLDRDLYGTFIFDGLKAIAARVTVDGEVIGWWWEGRSLSARLSKGPHTVRLDCAQSTYNVYGPHRYYLGDYSLTCGLHFEGIKNFADAPDAPDPTFTSEWKFVKFEIAGDIEFR